VSTRNGRARELVTDLKIADEIDDGEGTSEARQEVGADAARVGGKHDGYVEDGADDVDTAAEGGEEEPEVEKAQLAAQGQVLEGDANLVLLALGQIEELKRPQERLDSEHDPNGRAGDYDDVDPELEPVPGHLVGRETLVDVDRQGHTAAPLEVVVEPNTPRHIGRADRAVRLKAVQDEVEVEAIEVLEEAPQVRLLVAQWSRARLVCQDIVGRLGLASLVEVHVVHLRLFVGR